MHQHGHCSHIDTKPSKKNLSVTLVVLVGDYSNLQCNEALLL